MTTKIRFNQIEGMVVSVKDRGAVGDGVTDDSAATQATIAFCISNNKDLHFPDGNYLLSNIDLTSTSGYRGIKITCSSNAVFTAPDNSTDIFDISGQRRMNFTGGIFKKCRRAFSSTNTLPAAYCVFSKIRFEPDLASDIGAGFYGDSYIGNRFDKIDFGWDQVADGIDSCVDFTATSVNQTNVNIFESCIFIHFKNYGIRLQDSAYLKAGTAIKSCWFEDSTGQAIYAGTNTKTITIEGGCYFESLGSATAYPVEASSATRVDIKNSYFTNSNSGMVAWVKASGGSLSANKNTIGLRSGEVFADFYSILETQQLRGNVLQATGAPTYRAALFNISSAADEHFIDWEIPKDSTTTTGDEKRANHANYAREFSNGFVRWQCDNITLTNDTTWYTVAQLAFPSASCACRISVEIEALHQSLSVDCIYRESFVTKDGVGNPTEINISNTTAGAAQLECQIIQSSPTLALVQIRRTAGGAATIVAPLIEIRQSDWNITATRISITS